MGSYTAVKTLFVIWDLFVIFLLIEGGIGSIKRLVQVQKIGNTPCSKSVELGNEIEKHFIGGKITIFLKQGECH
ncbi:hypothetical protein [Candidatus Kuenenia sp.]|uniref:hypothetical protein n=1 Tax=Candidatus Kuenenia sp. TaxID=2499824 RepID=UPI00321F9CCA